MVVIFMLFSPVHILRVLLIFTICFGLHAILLYFLHIPFPGLLLPPQAAVSLRATCCSYQDRESGPPFQEQSGERGPEKASVMSLGVRSEFLLEDFYHL